MIIPAKWLGSCLLFGPFLYVLYTGFNVDRASLAKVSQSSPPIRTAFPQKIWQTWKEPLSIINSELVLTWQKLNPEHRYELLTDASAETYVQEKFQISFPKIVDTYLAITNPAFRSDFLRYLVLLEDGGVYSDIDTRNLKPVSIWVPSSLVEKSSLVIGIEVDDPGNIERGGRVDFGFCQWTIMSKPGHAILATVVQDLMQSLWDLAKSQNTTLNNVVSNDDDVLRLTGPRAFTAAVMKVLAPRNGGINATKQQLRGLTAAKLIDDVLVLPVTSFAPGQPHSHAGTPEDEIAYVQHMFKGSWRTHGSEAAKESV
ncbi:hypothetical protein MMC06_001791 [Schaereria dolodes]|nr:hypothetical protein [Schaereria dolodes]